MAEIRIKYSDAEAALSKLQAAAQTIEPSMPADISGQNVLDTVKKLNAISHSLQQTLTAYQRLLTKNSQAAKDSIQMMREMDEEIAHGMVR
ncbi:YwqI/YxiC family protein [Fictibacillus iocasae]|uniref:YwqI/YxiC family protein n=1 Tax=Fictibacillus iocasae TaxID=2715437 RepID=A0ABW2NX18_9BACL